MMANLDAAKRSVVQAEFRREASEELHYRFIDALTDRKLVTPQQVAGIEAETGEDAIRESKTRDVAGALPKR
jgi:hypothetical protein